MNRLGKASQKDGTAIGIAQDQEYEVRKEDLIKSGLQVAIMKCHHGGGAVLTSLIFLKASSKLSFNSDWNVASITAGTAAPAVR